MKLYFDIGNTNIKLYYQLNNKEYLINFITNKNYSSDSFFKELPQELKSLKISSVFIVSVVPLVEEIIIGTIKKYWKIKPQLLEPPLKTGIKIATDNPKEVGSDLIALSAFVASKKDNAIIVNLGTATTIIKVVNRTLLGTIIIPGISISFNSLIKRASKLSDLKLQVPQNKLGKNTKDSISLGIIKGHVHMINGFIKELKDQNTVIFVSGGHSKKVMSELPSSYEWVKEATLQGLKIIVENNNGN